jgi:starvation-inducible outer membrane lipoprotein
MRILLMAFTVALAGCSISNEPEQDKVTVTYDEARIKKAADTTKRAAKEVGGGVVNVTKGTAEVIKREVGDVDVDVRVTRKPAEPGE